MIVIIDYGMGNLCSIGKALTKIGVEFKISNKIEDLESASHLILPGVGFFKEGMKNLNELGLIPILEKEVILKHKPLLGICLGMQLLFKQSQEGGCVKGLNFIDGTIKKFSFDNNTYKIPHIGWNSIFGANMDQISILNNIKENIDFYFVHSYHVVFDSLNKNVKFAYTHHGNNFIAVVQKNNLFGTQFHPEKSQKKGLQILQNFVLYEK